MRLTLTTKASGDAEVQRITVEAIYVDHQGHVGFKRDALSNWDWIRKGDFVALESYNDLHNEREQRRWEAVEQSVHKAESITGATETKSMPADGAPGGFGGRRGCV